MTMLAIRGQLDYDVRTAFLNLNAAKEQVEVEQGLLKPGLSVEADVRVR